MSARESKPRFTVKDPQYAIVCGGCRFNVEHRCMGTFTISKGIYCGSYTCSCIRPSCGASK